MRGCVIFNTVLRGDNSFVSAVYFRETAKEAYIVANAMIAEQSDEKHDPIGDLHTIHVGNGFRVEVLWTWGTPIFPQKYSEK
jgi:secreted PhoX family phosphatase